jgi:bifunctional non-homologous end joining protein LigD
MPQGERAVVLLPDGRSSFQALQQRLSSDPPGDTVDFAFDLLRLEGEDLRPLPLTERKARLARLLRQGRRRSGPATKGLEGLIAKRSDAAYQSGRSRLWLKVNCQNRQEFVVIGFVEPKLVAEVTFTEWTKDGVLRHPSFVGLREDKAPCEVRREEPMQVAGITLSNPDRVLYPDQGLTKQDLAAYFEAIAPWMLPHVEGRPLSLVRCPSGTASACFYQKHWSGTLPEALDTVEIKEGSGNEGAYTVVHDAAGLVSLVQHGVLEIHLWGAREDDVDSPDRIIFDLDPSPGVTWARVKEGALRLKTVLEELGLETWIKTTGGKGLHVALPIARRSSWSEVSSFARAVAQTLSGEEPEKYLAKASKAERKGRIFVDWLRNTRGATAIAPWSTRARAGAPISAPIVWKDLPALTSGAQYTVENAHALAGKQRKDPWEGMLTSNQRLTSAMLKQLTAHR